MGMFNSLFVDCPACGARVQFQTKIGDCNLDCYTIYDVPPIIALDLQDDIMVCTNCSANVRLQVQSMVNVRPYII